MSVERACCDSLAQYVCVCIGQGVRVRVSGLATGTAALTDLHDGWVPDALAGFSEGQSIRAVRLPSKQPTGRARQQSVACDLHKRDGLQSAELA